MENKYLTTKKSELGEKILNQEQVDMIKQWHEKNVEKNNNNIEKDYEYLIIKNSELGKKMLNQDQLDLIKIWHEKNLEKKNNKIKNNIEKEYRKLISEFLNTDDTMLDFMKNKIKNFNIILRIIHGLNFMREKLKSYNKKENIDFMPYISYLANFINPIIHKDTDINNLSVQINNQTEKVVLYLFDMIDNELTELNYFIIYFDKIEFIQNMLLEMEQYINGSLLISTYQPSMLYIITKLNEKLKECNKRKESLSVWNLFSYFSPNKVSLLDKSITLEEFFKGSI